MCNVQVREIVGTVLVNDAPASSTPGPYIPTFYQSTSGIKCPTEANVCSYCLKLLFMVVIFILFFRIN